MRKLVRSAEVLCLPSLSESFGIVMIEALASGTPVVGFGPTFTEIRERLGVEIGEPVWEGTAEEVRAGLESRARRGTGTASSCASAPSPATRSRRSPPSTLASCGGSPDEAQGPRRAARGRRALALVALAAAARRTKPDPSAPAPAITYTKTGGFAGVDEVVRISPRNRVTVTYARRARRHVAQCRRP